jgi:hypothetical protein
MQTAYKRASPSITTATIGSSTAGNRERTITKMLLAVVGVFLMCNVLAFINNVIDMVFQLYEINSEDLYWFNVSIEV